MKSVVFSWTTPIGNDQLPIGVPDAHRTWFTAVRNYLDATYHLDAERVANFANFATDGEDKFLTLLAAIESSGTDLTADYTDWFRIGCAIARTYGEQGREYFHTISKFHNSYTIMETDKKYDDCLRDPNQQVSLGTIFHLAKKAGLAFSYGESGGMVLRTEHSRGEDCQSGKVGKVGNSANSANSFATPAGALANPDTLSEFIQSILLADIRQPRSTRAPERSSIYRLSPMVAICWSSGRCSTNASLNCLKSQLRSCDFNPLPKILII